MKSIRLRARWRAAGLADRERVGWGAFPAGWRIYLVRAGELIVNLFSPMLRQIILHLHFRLYTTIMSRGFSCIPNEDRKQKWSLWLNIHLMKLFYPLYKYATKHPDAALSNNIIHILHIFNTCLWYNLLFCVIIKSTPTHLVLFHSPSNHLQLYYCREPENLLLSLHFEELLVLGGIRSGFKFNFKWSKGTLEFHGKISSFQPANKKICLQLYRILHFFHTVRSH